MFKARPTDASEHKMPKQENVTVAPAAQARGRITARLSAEKQEMLQLAADLSGSTLNQFVVQSALKAAERVIEQEEALKTIKLSVEQSRRFLAILDEPAKPNEALKRAVARYRRAKIADSDSTFDLGR